MNTEAMITEYEQIVKAQKAPRAFYNYEDLNNFHDVTEQYMSKIKFPNGSTGWNYLNFYQNNYSFHDARLKATFGPIADVTIGGGFLGNVIPGVSQKYTCYVKHADQFEGSVKLIICTILNHIASAQSAPEQSLTILADEASFSHLSDQKFLDVLKAFGPGFSISVEKGTVLSGTAETPAASENKLREILNSSDQEALRNAGASCLEGNGESCQDFDTAFLLFRKAADLGDAYSQNAIGDFYYSGVSGSVDYPEAKKYYELAASNGSAQAMRSLGRMYAKGVGIEQDLKKACDLFQKAVDGGCTSARQDLSKTKLMLEMASGTHK